MSLSVYFRDDIAQSILSKMIVAVETAQACTSMNYDHLAGQMTAYKGMAASYGICWEDLMCQARASLGSGQRKLIEEVCRSSQ